MSGARPKGYARGRATKAVIVEQATEVFAESGFEGASLREISRRCGISHATLLHHFPTKVALLTAVMARRDADQLPVSSARGWTLEDVFGFFVALARHNHGKPGLARLHILLEAEAASPKHPARDYFVGRNSEWREVVTRLIARTAAEGGVAIDLDPKTITLMSLALWEGLELNEPLSAEPIDIADVLAQWFGLVLGRPLPDKGADLAMMLAAAEEQADSSAPDDDAPQ